jgi:hypothetical protein
LKMGSHCTNAHISKIEPIIKGQRHEIFALWQAQDIEELENEVEDLESLAKELKLGSSLDLDQRPPPPARTKGGKRKKKQAKVNPKSKSGGGGGGAVTLCQLMNICDSLPLGELEFGVGQSRKVKSRYGTRNRFQEPSLELSSKAT